MIAWSWEHFRRSARCLVPSPVLGEGGGECMISVTNSGCGARWTSPPARPGRGTNVDDSKHLGVLQIRGRFRFLRVSSKSNVLL